MTAHDTGVTELLRRASDGLTPDVDRLVSGGITRGRSHRRRARIGTTVATLAVIGVVGGLAAVVPRLGGADSARDPGIATDATSVTPVPDSTASPDAFTVPAAEFPATVQEILGLTDVSPALQEPPYVVEDTTDIKNARFRVDGMMVHVLVFGGQPGRDVPDGVIGPDEEWTKDGVTARSDSARRNGYVISVVAYNAADSASSPALANEPVLSASQLRDVVTSDAWFE